MSCETAGIGKLALQSRLLFVANVLIPDHDAGVFSPPMVDEKQFTVVDKTILFFLGGFRHWDAVYFLHIAHHGYTYENCVAFFPLYPMLISVIKEVSLLCPCLSLSSLLLVSGVVVNVALFVVTAVVLLQLGLRVTQDFHLSYLAAVLFCINPASIFMTAPYTETLFACLSFGGMLLIRQQKLFAGTILIGTSALTRSNGVVSMGFILHFLAVEYVQYIMSTYRAHRNSMLTFFGLLIEKTVTVGVRAVVFLLVGFIPFVFFQSYIYRHFCFPDNWDVRLDPALVSHGREEGYKLVGEGPVSPWCLDPIPLSYSYIQSHHWDVGFMKYYQVKQIPNFILAGPIIALSLCACYSFYLHRPDACRTLGVMEVDKYKVETVGSSMDERKSGWHSSFLVVYVLHLLFLTCFGCCFMHIQVLTRFLCSASPVIYWFAAHMVCEENEQKMSSEGYPCGHTNICCLSDLLPLYRQCSAQGKHVLHFFGGYLVIGTIAFSNSLPWT
ncbi:GPI alpha-1,6-mannosyltransferase 2-like isoform X2 [Babylonia areolata]|uniref:GPI alpha-1,6-mannosyltransferase 2-like isoform X2 n=1 Tax=Babylonia areolata TaxID=304850 RepID=UPI003FD4D9A0